MLSAWSATGQALERHFTKNLLSRMMSLEDSVGLFFQPEIEELPTCIKPKHADYILHKDLLLLSLQTPLTSSVSVLDGLGDTIQSSQYFKVSFEAISNF